MVGSGDDLYGDEVQRLLADMERLRGPLRITVRNTADGLGVSIPPARNLFATAFLCLWLCGWAAGEWFAINQILTGSWGPQLFLVIWLIPWTLAGAGVAWTILWQLFGTEQLFFTSGALVREWGLLGFGGRRVVMGDTIQSLRVAEGAGTDLAGLGTIKVQATGRGMSVGSGLSRHEAEFIVELINMVARKQGVTTAQDE